MLPPIGGTTQLSSGSTPLFEDPRIDWACDRLGEFGISIKNSNILELGPLEGAHSFILSHREASKVVAIEANKRSFLKCLIVKELYNINNVNFLLGEAAAHLRTTREAYDVGFACGILYHMTNPVELISLLARRCRGVFLWTVVYDPEFFSQHPDKLNAFESEEPADFEGFSYKQYRYKYGEALDWNGFCGGHAPFSNWLQAEDILRAFSHFGLSKQSWIKVPNVHSTALQLVACRP